MTTLVELAQEVLPQMEIISSVASAAIGIENRGENGLGFDANRSAFVSGNRVPIQIMRNARQAVHEDCLVLRNEPTIARVVSVCNNKIQTYYICRVAPPATLELENNMEVVSRDAPVGRLASLPPGKHTIEIERRGGRFENREHVILERTERGVRVFDIQHIKGLEFEAVFFVGLDDLAQQQQELFQKFLYVGATRAATYLGITCKGALTPILGHLRDCFGDNWK